ncbi:hypothetical protein DL98DRAFT_52020 [Cadophora sp. DSE1049]|nr:hypothetical protein DL98DRAFT_52020 [Cadophora sp. DSE1049]
MPYYPSEDSCFCSIVSRKSHVMFDVRYADLGMGMDKDEVARELEHPTLPLYYFALKPQASRCGTLHGSDMTGGHLSPEAIANPNKELRTSFTSPVNSNSRDLDLDNSPTVVSKYLSLIIHPLYSILFPSSASQYFYYWHKARKQLKIIVV